MHCLASLLFASVLVAVPSCERTRLHTPTADAGGTMALGGVTGTLADSSLVLVDAPMEVAQLLRVGTNYGSLMVVVYSDTSAVRSIHP